MRPYILNFGSLWPRDGQQSAPRLNFQSDDMKRAQESQTGSGDRRWATLRRREEGAVETSRYFPMHAYSQTRPAIRVIIRAGVAPALAIAMLGACIVCAQAASKQASPDIIVNYGALDGPAPNLKPSSGHRIVLHPPHQNADAARRAEKSNATAAAKQANAPSDTSTAKGDAAKAKSELAVPSAATAKVLSPAEKPPMPLSASGAETKPTSSR